MTVAQLPRPQVPAETTRWVVATLDRSSGFSQVRSVEGGLQLRVGDGRATVDPLLRGCGSLVTAALFDDGTIVVETQTAPPALLVSRSGAQLLPAAPGQCRPTRMVPGDRLLLCSAAALDAPPVGLVGVLKAPVDEVLRMSLGDLLDRVLDGTDNGAAAVVMRTADMLGPG